MNIDNVKHLKTVNPYEMGNPEPNMSYSQIKNGSKIWHKQSLI